MIGPEVTVPDLIEDVTGYRTFRLQRTSQHNYSLMSPYHDEVWTRPRKTARCTDSAHVSSKVLDLSAVKPKPHAAPHKNCGCGIYGYFKPCPVSRHSAYYHEVLGRDRGEEVAALMTFHGRIEVHSRGMRAGEAEIRALGTNKNLGADELAALNEIAREWGIPVVEQDELPNLAAQYGAPLPEEMRPEEEKPTGPLIERVHSDESTAPRLKRRRWWRHLVSWHAANGGMASFNISMYASTGTWSYAAGAMLSLSIVGFLFGRDMAPLSGGGRP